MSITPRGIHDHHAFVLTEGLGKCSRALLDDNVSPALLVWFRAIDRMTSLRLECRHNDFTLELGLADLALDLTAIDGKVTEVSKQLLGTILAADECEE